MKQGYQHFNSNIFLINYHFVFCTKRKKKFLTSKILKRTQELFIETIKLINCKIISLDFFPDHVHLYLSCTPYMAPNQIIHKIKNYSSKYLRKEFPELLKIPGTWTINYLVSTTRNISPKTIKKYVKSQNKK